MGILRVAKPPLSRLYLCGSRRGRGASCAKSVIHLKSAATFFSFFPGACDYFKAYRLLGHLRED